MTFLLPASLLLSFQLSFFRNGNLELRTPISNTLVQHIFNFVLIMWAEFFGLTIHTSWSHSFHNYIVEIYSHLEIKKYQIHKIYGYMKVIQLMLSSSYKAWVIFVLNFKSSSYKAQVIFIIKVKVYSIYKSNIIIVIKLKLYLSYEFISIGKLSSWPHIQIWKLKLYSS